MRILTLALVTLLAAPIFGGDGVPTTQPQTLRVHEWGTFTSVAGESGGPETWTPLSGPSDLPCFVYHLAAKCIKCIVSPLPAPATPPPLVTASTVRMETPVLYFYAPHRMTLSVKVDFPRGWITEWFPQASRVTPDIQVGAPLPVLGQGRIEWNNVEVWPGMQAALPTGQGASHYYAARNTDSDLLYTANRSESEKLLFYRGIANFPVPVWATVLDGQKVELRNTSDRTVPLAILFENRGGKVGYRTLRELNGTSQLETPDLTANTDALKRDLAAALIDMGLYPKEAQAMLDTWGDSWFEEGLRVFYLMPRRTVDDELPLAINPPPAAAARVFVGRVEMLSFARRRRLEAALAAGDTETLATYGRFLEPFARRIPGGTSANLVTKAYFDALLAEARRQVDAPSCVK